MDFDAFLRNVSIYAIPTLFAIALHEVAHGWMARSFGDRTGQMLGRLSLNPLRHIDPLGTVVVPGLMLVAGVLVPGALMTGIPVYGWANYYPAVACTLFQTIILAPLILPGYGTLAQFSLLPHLFMRYRRDRKADAV